MTRLHQRIITVDALSEPELSPAEKRLLYVGCMMLADDSGCLRWDARTIRGNLFPYGDMEHERIEALMAELEADDFAWPYTGSDGRLYAFLPAFPSWQKARTRQFAPEVPQPAGITFTPAPDMSNKGSGRYTYPNTRDELNPSQVSETSQPNGSEPVSSKEKGSCLKGPAPRPATDPPTDPPSGPLQAALIELSCATGRGVSEQEQGRLGEMLTRHGARLVTVLTTITNASQGHPKPSVRDVLDRAEAMCR